MQARMNRRTWRHRSKRCPLSHVFSAQGLAVRVDDGAYPLDDGQTQEGKTVSITCVYYLYGRLWSGHTMKMEFLKYGMISPVAERATLSQNFNYPSKYYFTEVEEGAYATRLEIKGRSNSRQQYFPCWVTCTSCFACTSYLTPFISSTILCDQYRTVCPYAWAGIHLN